MGAFGACLDRDLHQLASGKVEAEQAPTEAQPQALEAPLQHHACAAFVPGLQEELRPCAQEDGEAAQRLTTMVSKVQCIPMSMKALHGFVLPCSFKVGQGSDSCGAASSWDRPYQLPVGASKDVSLGAPLQM